MNKVLIGMIASTAFATSAVAQYSPSGPPPQQGGYNNGRYNNGGYNNGGYNNGGFWQGAPMGAHERIQFLQERINRGMSDGSLNRREAGGALHELDRIRAMDRNLHYRDHGRLTPDDEAMVQRRLDDLSHRIRWEGHNGR